MVHMSGTDLVTGGPLGRIYFSALLDIAQKLDGLAVGFRLAVTASVGVRVVGRTACFPAIFQL